MSCDLKQQHIKNKLCAKFGFNAIYALGNITNKLFLPVKAFEPEQFCVSIKIQLFYNWHFCICVKDVVGN